jgi:hypothetical protein
VPRSKKQSRAIPLLSLRVFLACKKAETYLPKVPKFKKLGYIFREDGKNKEEIIK